MTNTISTTPLLSLLSLSLFYLNQEKKLAKIAQLKLKVLDVVALDGLQIAYRK